MGFLASVCCQIMAGLIRNCSRLFLKNATSINSVRSMSGSHGEHGWKLWKNVFFFGCIPVIILGHVNAFGMDDGSPHRPEFVAYDYLRIRTKKFPWEMVTIASSTTPT